MAVPAADDAHPLDLLPSEAGILWNRRESISRFAELTDCNEVRRADSRCKAERKGDELHATASSALLLALSRTLKARMPPTLVARAAIDRIRPVEGTTLRAAERRSPRESQWVVTSEAAADAHTTRCMRDASSLRASSALTTHAATTVD
jgi:hypothetical protein